MRTSSSHRGSALLIVLGMLAFMVISAVAFSAYMRSSRLPSSFLRRTASSRLLVKAALAEAIEEIDCAIADNPYPGITVSTNSAVSDYKYYYPRSETGAQAMNRNWWKGRVYIGTNQNDTATGPLKITIDQQETVPTLTLEGLAYIPPSLVNEVRYYSRHSSASKWHSLPYDVGRYAFTAIDVSDYFDLNAVEFNAPRSSASDSRITLSYLFPDHVSTMQSCMDSIRSGLPFVSLADWNLSIEANSSFGVQSPFCKYVKNQPTEFYGASSLDDAGKMLFVTDSYLPVDDQSEESKDKKKIDLSVEANQPFFGRLTEPSYSVGYETVVGQMQNDTLDRLRKYMPQANVAALYDYLDQDSVPFSLSLPTTEKTPMIFGVKPILSGTSIAIESKYEPVDGEWTEVSSSKQQRQQKLTVVYSLKKGTLGMLGVDAMLMFPFRNVNSDTFRLRGRMALFFTSADMGLRPGSCVDSLKWSEDVDNNVINTEPFSFGVMSFPLPDSSPIQFQKLEDPKQLVKSVSFEVAGESVQKVDDKFDSDAQILKAEFVWTQTRTKNTDTGVWDPPTPTDFISAYANQGDCGMSINANRTLKSLAADGNNDAFGGLTGIELLKILQGGVNMNLNLAVWLQLVDANDRVVDMVPASVADDAFNDSPNANGAEGIGITDFFGGPTPLLRFDTGVNFTFKIDEEMKIDSTLAAANYPATPSPVAAMIADPRFNYAPEQWYQASDGDFTYDGWKEKSHLETGDGDFFLQVSDQRYLQSVYELANLPRLSKVGLGPGQAAWENDLGNMSKPETYSGKTIPAYDSEVNRDFMWKSYDPLGRYDAGGNLSSSPVARDITHYATQNKERFENDGFEAVGLVPSLDRGFRVNPWSDSTNVLMAVFANTPRNWRYASPYNNMDSLPDEALSFNQQYAWGKLADSTLYKFTDDDLNDFIGEFQAAMRDSSLTPLRSDEERWETAYDSLSWFDHTLFGTDAASKYLIFGGDQLENAMVYNTDRKFLYGFWRECFAAKQQLFLIFVRAEPSQMGSGAAGKAPPQLGGRAVALVWRDPKAAQPKTGQFTSADTEGVSIPHKTRILFYHPLD